MKELIKYELKKIVGTRKIWILIVVLSLLCVGSFAIISAMGNWQGAKEMLTLYSGSIENNPKIEAAKARYQEIRKQYIEAGIEMDADTEAEFNELEYPLWLARCDSVRKQNLEDMGFEAETLVVGDTIFYAFVEEFIANYLPFILGFVIAFLIAPVFAMEYGNHMDGLLLASKHGKRKLIFGKFVAAACVIIMAYVYVMGMFLILTICVTGIGDLNASFVFTADNVFIYLTSPYNFLVWQYLLVLLGCSLFGCLCFGCLTLLASSRCQNAISASMLSLALIYVPVLAFKMIGENEGVVPNILRLFHGSVIGVRTLFSGYFPVQIGQATLTMPVISIVFIGISSVLFGWAAFRSFQRHQVKN